MQPLNYRVLLMTLAMSLGLGVKAMNVKAEDSGEESSGLESQGQVNIDMQNLQFLEFLSMEMSTPEEVARQKLREFAQKLRINRQQQTQWDAFAENAVHDISIKNQRRQQRQRKMQQRTAPPTSLEMIDSHLIGLNQQVEDAQRSRQIVAELIAVMDEKQQALFNHAMRLIVFKKLQRFRSD